MIKTGKQICANCFRFFRHFLSNPATYSCLQLGRCDLTKAPRTKCSSESGHTSGTTATVTPMETNGKHIVKQQQLGMLGKSSSKLLSASTPHGPIGLKHFNLISSNGHSGPIHGRNHSSSIGVIGSFANGERIASTAHSSYTSLGKRWPATQPNTSISIDKENVATRCNACWLKRCVDVYTEIQFDEHIMQVLNDYRPVQLNPVLQNNRSMVVHAKPPIARSNRMYAGTKSKSMSRLFHESENTFRSQSPAPSVSWRISPSRSTPSSANNSGNTHLANVTSSALSTRGNNKSATLGRPRSYSTKSATVGAIELLQKLSGTRDSYADSGHCASNDSANNSVDLDRAISPDSTHTNRPLSLTDDCKMLDTERTSPLSSPVCTTLPRPSSTPPPPPPRRIQSQAPTLPKKPSSECDLLNQTIDLSPPSSFQSPAPQTSSPLPPTNNRMLDHSLTPRSLPMIHL